jgi:hypothetical protein
VNEERTGKCLRQVEHIRGHLWHRYSITGNQVMVATVKFSKWWLQLYQKINMYLAIFIIKQMLFIINIVLTYVMFGRNCELYVHSTRILSPYKHKHFVYVTIVSFCQFYCNVNLHLLSTYDVHNYSRIQMSELKYIVMFYHGIVNIVNEWRSISICCFFTIFFFIHLIIY